MESSRVLCELSMIVTLTVESLSALNDMEPPDKGEGKCIEERREKKT